MTWTEKHLKDLEDAGLIKGYRAINTTGVKDSVCKEILQIGKRANRKSKALIWLELNLPYWAKENGVVIEREYRFCQERKYRSDWAVPEKKILIEYEGGIFMKRGGHNSAAGIQRDIDKYSLAQSLGFTVIRLTAKNHQTVLEQLNEIIK